MITWTLWPEIGRFLQPDTIVPDPADPQSLNRYSYVLNNPLRYTDPTGREPEDWQYCLLRCGSGSATPPPENASFAGLGEWIPPAISRCTTTLFQDCNYSESAVEQYLDDFLWRTVLLAAFLEPNVPDINRLPWSAQQRLELHFAGFGIDAGQTLAESDFNLDLDFSAGFEISPKAVSLLGMAGVTFGHGFRHVAHLGLSEATVNYAITESISLGTVGIPKAGPFKGYVVVNGVIIEYNGFVRPNGVINVGTYVPFRIFK